MVQNDTQIGKDFKVRFSQSFQILQISDILAIDKIQTDIIGLSLVEQYKRIDCVTS